MKRVLMLLCATLILSGCATMTASDETSFCKLALPIAWSTKDTDETIRQVKSHNSVGIAICKW